MLEKNASLKAYNTFGLSVNAELFDEFSSIVELDQLVRDHQGLPLLVLGGGSNVLLTKNVPGLVLKNNLLGIEIKKMERTDVYVKAHGGEVWHDLVLYCISKNLGGIENLSLIPGCVGAAPMQNIGAYGVEVKDVFVELEAYNLQTGKLKTFSKEDCEFAYRESVFKGRLKGKYIITSITLKLSSTPTLNTSYGAIASRLIEMGINSPTIKNVSDAVVHIRKTKLPNPAEIGNSGSFFKNPVVSRSTFEELKAKYPDIANYPIDADSVKLAAGWLIDRAGWKGKTMGNYGVHKNQALVLVNYGGANGEDIYQLSEDILASIKTQYGVELEREVNVI